MNNRPIAHQIYRHFKGNLYQIQCIAKHSETGEEMVVYQALYGDYCFYVRPLSMFMEPVDRAKYPEAKQQYRFELVEELGSTVEPRSIEEIGVDSTDIYDESKIDPDVVKFWDADSYEQRVDILYGMRYKVTNDMIDMMSTVIDIDIKEDEDVQKRYQNFMNALEARRAYETNRLR